MSETPTPSWPGCGASIPSSVSTCRGCRTRPRSPSSWSTATTRSRRCCGTTRRSRPESSSTSSATCSASRSCSGWTSPSTAATAPWSPRRSRRRRWRAGRTSWSSGWRSELIDRFAGRGRAELVREFTFPYPTQIIAGLLGLPREDYPQFQRWSISLLSFTVNRERGIAASTALTEYFAPILAARREEPRDDLISTLAQAEIDGEQLSDEEIFSFLRLLLPAGVETTYRSTGNLLFGLLSNPEQLEAVRSDRSLIPQAIEEAIRWEAPLLIITRVATRDTELAGVPIPAGSAVMPMLGAANRDEDRYPDPDRFDIFREPSPHISFGHGVHVCLGMHLARLEMRVALELLLDRLPDLRFDPEGKDPHIRGQVFRSPTSLPVLFGPSSR